MLAMVAAVLFVNYIFPGSPTEFLRSLGRTRAVFSKGFGVFPLTLCGVSFALRLITSLDGLNCEEPELSPFIASPMLSWPLGDTPPVKKPRLFLLLWNLAFLSKKLFSYGMTSTRGMKMLRVSRLVTVAARSGAFLKPAGTTMTRLLGEEPLSGATTRS